jgi:hypothetical protein
MRKRFLIVSLIAITTTSWSQRSNAPEYHKKDDDYLFRFGYYLGINQMNFKTEYSRYTLDQMEIQPQLGFNVGLFADLRILDNINLRIEPGMFTTQRNLTFPENWPEVRNPDNRLREVKSTYIRVPLVLKFSTDRIHNVRPFVVGGVSTSFNLSSNDKNRDDNDSGQFRLRTKMNAFEVGFGVELYLPFFRLTPSIRGIFSMQDEIVPDNWTVAIQSLKTQGVFLNFIFQ